MRGKVGVPRPTNKTYRVVAMLEAAFPFAPAVRFRYGFNDHEIQRFDPMFGVPAYRSDYSGWRFYVVRINWGM